MDDLYLYSAFPDISNLLSWPKLSDHDCFILPKSLQLNKINFWNHRERLSCCYRTVGIYQSAERQGVVSLALLHGTKHMLLRVFALCAKLTFCWKQTLSCRLSEINTRVRPCCYGNKHSFGKKSVHGAVSKPLKAQTPGPLEVFLVLVYAQNKLEIYWHRYILEN